MKILITGGGSDIGKATAELLKNKTEYEIALVNKTDLDITNQSYVERFLELNKPDVIINCAGYIVPQKLSEITYHEYYNHFHINVLGLCFLIKHGILNGCKMIINVGSTSALEGRAEWGLYCASKAAALSLIETAAKEGITAYNIHPSRTATKMREKLFPDEDKSKLMSCEVVADVIKNCVNKIYPNGSSIVVRLDKNVVLPMREVIK